MFDHKVLPSINYTKRVSLTKQMEETPATVTLASGSESIKIVTQILFWLGLVL